MELIYCPIRLYHWPEPADNHLFPSANQIRDNTLDVDSLAAVGFMRKMYFYQFIFHSCLLRKLLCICDKYNPHSLYWLI